MLDVSTPRSCSRSVRALIALLVVAGAFAAAGKQAPAALAYPGNILYTPNLSQYPNASANYTWSLRLQYSGSANGTVLAIHDDGIDLGSTGSGEPMGFPIYSSADNGQTWSSLSRITDTVHGWQMFEPMLYELPSQIGSGSHALAAGTILGAGLALGPIPQGQTSPFGADLEVYKSTDHGATWSYLSSCATIPTNTQVFGAGIWEPDLEVDSSGNLVCYFSDERDSGSSGGPGNTGHYNQLIGHVVSTDGGQTWGAEAFDVAVNDGVQRPGMPDVITLPNNTYFMAYEVCGQPDCQVRYRTSADGDNWGTASTLGTVIQTAGGKILGHTPFVTWTAAGGSNGTLIISAMHLDNSDGSAAPENGTALMANTNLGAGNWTEVAAPLRLTYGSDCAGWRQALLPTPSGAAVLQLASTSIANNKCEIRYATGDSGTLPYYAPLASGTDAGWTTYGGTWSVSGGAYTDSAGGVGDKSVTGSSGWSDYTLQGDVKLNSSADAGLILRVTNPAVGIDAFSGYYLGIDANAGMLVLGRENNGWTQLQTASMSVSLSTWYHLTAQAIGCVLTVSAQAVGSTSVAASFSYADTGCSFTAGQVGVRAHNTVASWRNLSVTADSPLATLSPYYAPFASGAATGWTTYGGIWSDSSSNETYSDSTGGSGDKAVAGSTTWSNYTLQGDVDLTSAGDAGLIFRVTNPSTGADAYNGYYLGVDNVNSALVLGRENGSWTSLHTTSMTVSLSTWYHLTAQAVGCTFTVSAQPVSSSSAPTTFTYTDSGCSFTAGEIGVRTHNSVASWRHVTVTGDGSVSSMPTPYYAPFASGTATGWTTYGGTWSDSGTNETYSDTAGGGGDKSVAGSTTWSDYTLQGDVKLTSAGDAGLILRVTNPTTGADAYNGYYLGVDSVNGILVLGRENNSWTGLQTASMSVSLNTWYHLTAQAIGCTFTVSAQAVGATSIAASFTYIDTGCSFTDGQVGVRTHNAVASWRDVMMTPNGVTTSTFGAYYAPFASGTATGWTTYGGMWTDSASNETYSDSAAGTGDKAVAGSTAWSNYTLQGDVEMASGGSSPNAGLLVRVTNPSVGADALNGYFAGITSSGTLILGREAGSWTQLASVSVPGGISWNIWYHMVVQVQGCSLTVTAQSVSSADQGSVVYTDSGCTQTQGQIGVRTYNASASWRYVAMSPQ